MADREKVINGLECAIQYGPHYCGGEFGDENEYSRIEQNVLVDALALLKAQEVEKAEKEKIPEYPCKNCCSPSERAACCGCEKERQWQTKYGKQEVR